MTEVLNLNTYTNFFTEIFYNMFHTGGLWAEAVCFGWSPNLITLTIMSNIFSSIGYLNLANQFFRVYRSKSKSTGEIVICRYTWILPTLSFIVVIECVNHIINILVLFLPYYYLQQILILLIGGSCNLIAIIIKHSFKAKA